MGELRTAGEVIDEVQVHFSAARAIEEEIKRLQAAKGELEFAAERIAAENLGANQREMILTVARAMVDHPGTQERVLELAGKVMASGAIPLSVGKQSVAAPAAATVVETTIVVSAPDQVQPQAQPQPPVVEVREEDAKTVLVMGIPVPGKHHDKALLIVEEARKAVRDGGRIDAYSKMQGINRWKKNLYEFVFREEAKVRVPHQARHQPAVQPPRPATHEPRQEPVAALVPVSPAAQSTEATPPVHRPNMRRPSAPRTTDELPLLQEPAGRDDLDPDPETVAEPLGMDDGWSRSPAPAEVQAEDDDTVYGDDSVVDGDEDNSTGIDPSDLPDFLTSDEPIEEEPVAEPHEERWSEPFASGRALSDRVMDERQQASFASAAVESKPVEHPAQLSMPRRPPQRATPGHIRHGLGINNTLSDEQQAMLDRSKAG